MEIVLLTEAKNLAKVKDILLKDPVISGASIMFKEAKILTNKEGYYCYISGIEEQGKKALELTKDLAKVLDEKEKSEVITKIKEEESKARDAFGGLF